MYPVRHQKGAHRGIRQGERRLVPVQRRGHIFRPRNRQRYPTSTPKLRKMSNAWHSERVFTPLLGRDFSTFFDKCCTLYPHYLDTVLYCVEIIKAGQNLRDINDGFGGTNNGLHAVDTDELTAVDTDDGFPDLNNGFPAVDTDLFLPKGLYKGEKGVDIIFDSGCTHAVTPHETDFVGRVTPVAKVMNGLGAKANITGEGTVIWKFRDDYGVTKSVQVKAYLVPASKVRLFSPQAYFQSER